MKKVVIMMSTYNGEEYLRRQVETVLSQTGVDVELLMRDDNSTDGTREILNALSADARIKIIEDNRENLGPANSFMELLYQAPCADYYAFADQDDVWLSSKLLRAVETLDAFEHRYKLYASNQILADKNEKVIGLRFQNAPKYSAFDIIMCNRLSGCTMVFNRNLMEELAKESRRPDCRILSMRMHDVWVALVASCIGIIIYDEAGHILYRQHERNVEGGFDNQKLHISLKNLRRDRIRYRSGTAKEVKRCFGDMLDGEALEIVSQFSALDTMKGKYDFCRNELIYQYSRSYRYLYSKAIAGLL